MLPLGAENRFEGSDKGLGQLCFGQAQVEQVLEQPLYRFGAAVPFVHQNKGGRSVSEQHLDVSGNFIGIDIGDPVLDADHCRAYHENIPQRLVDVRHHVNLDLDRRMEEPLDLFRLRAVRDDDDIDHR